MKSVLDLASGFAIGKFWEVQVFPFNVGETLSVGKRMPSALIGGIVVSRGAPIDSQRGILDTLTPTSVSELGKGIHCLLDMIIGQGR